jgi:bifunctional polynucleotide phosphatase/kinase
VPPSSAILFLDIDDTLIQSNKHYAPKGWRWLFASVPQRVRAYYEAGYKVVLVTNQCLVQDSEATAREKLGKMQGVAAALGVPCQVFMATHRDFCYKPYPGAFWLLAGVCNGGVPIHTPSCLYVGDAAGRLGDHSLADLGLAFNIGAPCTTPEAFFGGSRSALLVRPVLFLQLFKTPLLLLGKFLPVQRSLARLLQLCAQRAHGALQRSHLGGRCCQGSGHRCAIRAAWALSASVSPSEARSEWEDEPRALRTALRRGLGSEGSARVWRGEGCELAVNI